MNTKAILSQVENLHNKALLAKPFTLKLRGQEFDFIFNGRNFEISLDGKLYLEVNTRIKKEAKKFLIDYLNN